MPVTVESILEAIENGDKRHLADAVIGDNAFEYDEDVWHNVERDVEKTLKLLQYGSVTRLRRGCATLTHHIDDVRYVEILIDTKNTVDQLVATAQALRISLPSKAYIQRALKVGDDAHVLIDERRANAELRMQVIFGSTLDCHGILTRMWNDAFCTSVEWLAQKVGNDKLVTFMCDGVASRLGNPEFHDAIEWLAQKVGKNKLVTFMCGSVASRLGSPEFHDAIEWLAQKVGNDKLVTIMCNSVASRLGSPEFHDAIEWLAQKVGDDKLATIMCNSVASRLGNPEFHDAIEWLAQKVGNDKLVTFMCDGVASRLGNPEFHDAIEWLAQKVGNDKLATIMCDGVASRLGNREFQHSIDMLTQYAVDANLNVVDTLRQMLYYSPCTRVIDKLVPHLSDPTKLRGITKRLRGTYKHKSQVIRDTFPQICH